jgi:hypothetical protein
VVVVVVVMMMMMIMMMIGENNVGELVEFSNVLLVFLWGRVKCGIIIYKHYV